MSRPPLTAVACWTLTFLVAAPGIRADPPAAPAETRSVADRLGDLKPVPADPADTPVRKLLKERYNARLQAAKIQLAAVRAGAAARLNLTGLIDRLALDGAELEDKPADRVKWLQLRLDALREQERLAKARADQGALLEMDALLLTAARAEAELDLVRLQEAVKEKK